MGGDCEYPRNDAEVLGRIGEAPSQEVTVFGGRKAARRKMSLRAAILSGETITVRFGMIRLSPPLDRCCSRWRLRCHLGPSKFSHSVWLPRKAVSKLKKKKFSSRLPAHFPSHRASSRHTPHLPWPVMTRGMRIPLTRRCPARSTAFLISGSNMRALGWSATTRRTGGAGAFLRLERDVCMRGGFSKGVEFAWAIFR